MENVAFTYQWLSDDAEIGGATGSTYTLLAGDEGATIKVKVTFTDDAGKVETLTSGATTAVAAADPPAKPIDTTAPTISSIAVTSDPGYDDTYAIGESIEVTVTFSEDRNCYWHTPA